MSHASSRTIALLSLTALGLAIGGVGCKSEEAAPEAAMAGMAGAVSAVAGQAGMNSSGQPDGGGSVPTAGAGGSNGISEGPGSTVVDLYVPDGGAVWHHAESLDASVPVVNDDPDPALVPTVSTKAPLSSLPLATFEIVTPPSATGIEIVSFNAVAEPLDAYYLYIHVRNSGTFVICYPTINAVLETAAGAPLLTSFSFVTSPRYQIPDSTIVAPCLGPGQEGVAWDIQLLDHTIALSATSHVKIGLDGEHFVGALVHPATPTLNSAIVSIPFVGNYAVTGQVTGTSQTVEDVSFDVFPQNAQGLVFDHLSDISFGTLAVGQTLAFSTLSTDTAFVNFKTFIDFNMPL